MKQKPITPYARLKEACVKWASSVIYPKRKPMFSIEKKRLGEGWSLSDAWERTKAAEQLGYDVMLIAGETELRFVYVEKRPTELPWELR